MPIGKTTGRRVRKDSFVTTAMTAVGTSYAAAKAGTLVIKTAAARLRIEPAYILGAVSSISSATKITVLISTDSSGDVIIAPETEVTISVGVTTAAKGAFALKWDIPFVDAASTESTWYIICKTDAGTLTVDSVDLYSFEDA